MEQFCSEISTVVVMNNAGEFFVVVILLLLFSPLPLFSTLGECVQ